MTRSVGSSVSSSRTLARVVPIRPTKTGKLSGAAQKPCENSSGNGLLKLCKNTLSTRSKFKKCARCRAADKKWSAASAKDKVEWHRIYALRMHRIEPHLPDDVANVRKRA